jgi:glycosyltransferase involved in cell wall biosynthesis
MAAREFHPPPLAGGREAEPDQAGAADTLALSPPRAGRSAIGPIERLFVVDPVRHDRRGHHWHFAEGALREATRAGFSVRFFVARSAAGRPLPGPDIHPVIRQGLYLPVTGDREESFETDYGVGGMTLRDDLLGCAAFDPGARDLILVPTASLRTVAGLVAWRAATGSPTPVAFLFHDILPEGASLAAETPAAAMARRAGTALRESGARSLVGATNRTLADELAAALGIEVPVLPQPHWYELDDPAASPVAPPAPDGVPTVAFLGELRRDKGGHLLPAIAARLHKAGPPARLVAQAGFAEPGLAEQMRKAAHAGAAATIERHLSNAEFARLIRDAALLLLPYERARYRARISGPFAFAVAAGRPSIVPDETWMAAEIAAGRAAGIAYAGDSAEAVGDAIAAALRDLPALTRAAEARAAAWRADNGSALIERLVNWASAR